MANSTKTKLVKKTVFIFKSSSAMRNAYQSDPTTVLPTTATVTDYVRPR